MSELSMNTVGYITAKVKLEDVLVTVNDDAPLEAILMHPSTLDNLLGNAGGRVYISATKGDDATLDAGEDTSFNPEQFEKEQEESVTETVCSFFDEFGITGPGGMEDVPHDLVATSEEVMDEVREQFKISIPTTDDPEQHAFNVVMDALKRSITRNNVYEELIVQLGDLVGFPEPEEDEEGCECKVCAAIEEEEEEEEASNQKIISEAEAAINQFRSEGSMWAVSLAEKALAQFRSSIAA